MDPNLSPRCDTQTFFILAIEKWCFAEQVASVGKKWEAPGMSCSPKEKEGHLAVGDPRGH